MSRLLRASRTIDVPAEQAWEILTDVSAWPSWGPTVRAARLDGDELGLGATGSVSPLPRLWLPFEITEWEAGLRWAWTVAGVAATDHAVEPLDESRCRVTFGVPWWAPAYLGPCAVAQWRIDGLLTHGREPGGTPGAAS